MRGPTNEELIADMLAVYRELGYLTHATYTTYGLHHAGVIERRFGSFSRGCQIANIPVTRKSKRLVPMVTTVCLSCDEWFDRPKDDKSCRRCKTCRTNLQYAKPVNEEFSYVC